MLLCGRNDDRLTCRRGNLESISVVETAARSPPCVHVHFSGQDWVADSVSGELSGFGFLVVGYDRGSGLTAMPTGRDPPIGLYECFHRGVCGRLVHLVVAALYAGILHFVVHSC